MRARAQTAEIFRRNSFACVHLSLPAPLGRLSARYRLAPPADAWLAGPDHTGTA